MSRPRLTLLGDSLVAGYGLARADALPHQLALQLGRLGCAVTVTDAGVSGDTTADGLRRLDRDVPSDTRLCLVVLGANDMMQRVDLATIARNLDSLLTRLNERGIPPMLAGMRAPPWFGAYGRAFDDLFAAAAHRHGARLDPFLLKGVALDPAYTLADGIHPNASAVRIIARRLATPIADALNGHGPTAT